MANVDRPHGFDPFGVIRDLSEYSVDVSNATAVFIGDLVALEADGNAIPAAAGSAAIVGASAGYLAATTAGTVRVYGDPSQRFVAQTVSGQTPTQALIGDVADHIAGTGSAVTLLSGHEINIAASDDGIMMLDFLQNPENEVDEHADMICIINEHLLHGAASTEVGD